MLYAVLFTDQPNRLNVRSRLMPQHLEFLEHHRERIRAAGPLVHASANEPAGGLWLVDANDDGEVVELVHADPFWPTGLRQTVRVLEWKRVFADGRRLVGSR